MMQQAEIWAAIVQAISSAVGLVGLFFAVVYARAAWKAAEKSASAADNTLRATLESEQRQMRAYVFIDTIEEYDFEVGKEPRVAVSFTNRGATPATDVIFRNRLELYPIDVPDGLLVPPELDDVSSSPIAQGSGGRGDVSMMRVLTQPLFNGYLEGEAMFILTGVIEYSDIYGERRETGYRFRKRLDRQRGDMAVASDGNYYT